jgi:hypothetical protein
MKALFPKTVLFFRNNILGICLVGIFSSIVASFIYSSMQSIQTSDIKNVPSVKTLDIKSVPSVKTLSKPLPREIVKEVETRPPLQQEEAGKYYIGQRFRWHVVLMDAYKSSNGKDNTIFFKEKNDKRGYASVFIDIPIGRYPSLQTAKEETEFYITGTVSGVRGRIISLTDGILE